MQELSLHLLDLMENSVRAGASVIALAVEEDRESDRLRLIVEDDGPGFALPAEHVLDPFYTTKRGKRTGLGLSLLRLAAEQAGGGLTLSRSALGGAAVRVEMGLSHVDRSPLGDLATTVQIIVGTNPGLEVRCRVRAGRGECTVGVKATESELPDGQRNVFTVATRMAERIRRGLAEVGATA